MTNASQTSATSPFARTAAATEPIRRPDGSAWRILATGAETGGVVGVVEFTLPPGRGFPLHIHHHEDEAHYVLEGTLLFVAGDMRVEAGPGTYIFAPRGLPHGFKALGETPVRFVENFLPAGLEMLFAQPDELQAAAELGRTNAAYGLEVVGPLPE